MAQYAYNNAENEKMKMSLFFANYGYNLIIAGPCLKESLSLSAIENTKRLRGLHNQLAKDAEFINLMAGQYYDKKHKNVPHWREGDKVYLRRKNIQTKRPSMKLDFTKLGPFKIQRKLSPVTFKLELPKDSRLHPVFHAALLEMAPWEIPIQTTFQMLKEQEYEVKEILDAQEMLKGQEYLVLWKGYSAKENS